MTGKQQYAKELLASLDDSERLLRLLADGERVVRSYMPPPFALEARVEMLKLAQQVGYYCHETVVNAEVEPTPFMR